MSSNIVEWSKYDKVGTLNILTLSEKTSFVPEFKSLELMNKFMHLKNENQKMQDLELLVTRLTRHMSSLKESQLTTGQVKSEITRQCNIAGVDATHLKKGKNSLVQCNETINSLNRILFCQQIFKCNGQLSSAMIENLQDPEPAYVKMKLKLSGQKDQDFELFSKVLYKKAFIFN